MKINDTTFELTATQYDYGVPVVFETDDGFLTGDKIVFTFSSGAIKDKLYEVNSEKYSFEMKLDEDEANAIFSVPIHTPQNIKYSIKHIRNGVFLDSIENDLGDSLFNLRINRTVRYNGETESE